MTSTTTIAVVECSAISPPPSTVLPTTLTLTFFDIPWLFFSPTQPLFFYDFPTSTANFTQTILPKLKHFLSLTLQHFFPLAGKLVIPSAQSAEPHLEYTEHDYVLLSIAEAAADEFKKFTGNHRKMGLHFHGLVPELAAGAGAKRSLLAMQITVFPNTGICMGFTLRNVVADWRTFNNFLRAWASLSKNGGTFERHVAFHDRSVVLDPSRIRSIFLKEFWKMKNNILNEVMFNEERSNSDLIRATFVLGPKEMEQIKKWILTRSDIIFGSTQLLLSPYVITCAFIWVCWARAHWSLNQSLLDQTVHYFGFIAGGLTRLPYAVPNTYVGNCVGFGRSMATREELLGQNDTVFAAKAIGDSIKKLNGDMLGGAKNWISEWKEICESELHIRAIGSPKVNLYDLDFGWGRPVKVEEVSINGKGTISLNESREIDGGIEIGVALPKLKMDDFTTLFNKGLNHYLSTDDN